MTVVEASIEAFIPIYSDACLSSKGLSSQNDRKPIFSRNFDGKAYSIVILFA